MSRTVTAVSISLLTSLLMACGSPTLRQSADRLAACSGAPHCVSSQDADPARRIEPIAYTGTRAGAQQLMVSILRTTADAKIITVEDGYIHATFTTPTVGFVDDLELLFSSQKFIDVRSSSRIGYYDFGINRNRVETLRKTFNGLQP